MAKNDNLLAILWMLNSGEKITADEISDRLEISVRTAYRYIDSLCASGVPIISEAGHNGGFSLSEKFMNVPLFFDFEEQKALLNTAILTYVMGYPFSDSVNTAAKKIESYINEDEKTIINQRLKTIDYIQKEILPDINYHLKELEAAVINKISVEIDYTNNKKINSKTRIIDPYGIIYWGSNWYTVGFCHLRNEIRIFRIDRIQKLSPTQMKFNKPEDFSSKDFFLRKLLNEADNKSNMISLIITGKPDILNSLCNNWYLNYYLKDRTMEKAEFLVDEEALYEYIPNLILRYGKAVKIIEPKSLKDRIIEIISELNEYYKI